MKKAIFEEPELKVIHFGLNDVIATSTDDVWNIGDDDDNGNGNGKGNND